MNLNLHVVSCIGIHSDTSIYIDVKLKAVDSDEEMNSDFKSNCKQSDKLHFDLKCNFRLCYPEYASLIFEVS